MSNQTELMIPAQPGELARPEPTIGEILSTLCAGGITKDNAEAVASLIASKQAMDARNAEREFNRDFVLLMQDIPKIRAMKSVPGRDGSIRFSFAPLEEIENQLRPLLAAHGFFYVFSEGESRQGCVTKVCTVGHRGGHSRNNSYTVRIGSGPPGCTESQSDGAAHSYAKRGALCDAFAIQIDKTAVDPHAEGSFITEEQAEELERRVAETNSSRDAFLKFAGANMTAKNPWATITARRYSECDEMLRRKEGKR